MLCLGFSFMILSGVSYKTATDQININAAAVECAKKGTCLAGVARTAQGNYGKVCGGGVDFEATKVFKTKGVLKDFWSDFDLKEYNMDYTDLGNF